MKKSFSGAALLLLCTLGFVVGLFLLSNFQIKPGSIATSDNVNIDQAREAYHSGGELTYDEVVALRRDIVGDPTELRKELDKYVSSDWDKYKALSKAFDDREWEFVAQIAKCKLKETIGWVAYWGPDANGSIEIPGAYRLEVYMFDPRSDDEHTTDQFYTEVFIVGLSEEQIANMKYGHRIRFSGDLALVDRRESVKNAKIELLPEDPAIPTPTGDELADLHIVLERWGCFGECPSYVLTIEATGDVTFQGRDYTKVRGTVKGKIEQAELYELAREVKKADFFGLAEDYPIPESAISWHFSQHQITVRMNGKTKTVTDHTTGPRRLSILQDRIDQIVNSEQWIR